MVEQQIEVKILVTDGHPFLAREEREVRTKFQKESLEFLQDCRLQISLAVSILQTQEIEQVGIAENELGCQPVRLPKLLEILANGRFGQPGDCGTFEHHAADSVTEHADAPPFE